VTNSQLQTIHSQFIKYEAEHVIKFT